MVAGEASGEEFIEQGVAQLLGGGDDLLGALDCFVDGVKDGGDGSLLAEGRDKDRERSDTIP